MHTLANTSQLTDLHRRSRSPALLVCQHM